MKMTKHKKIIIFIIILIIGLCSTSVFAEINLDYATNDYVSSEGMEEAIESSTLLKSLGRLVYGAGAFLEWILGTIFRMLTGNSAFPWADKIVFNAVPLLDINFMNPGYGSFLINADVSAAIKNIYATILSISVSFFGVLILITAIKLVISTIASDKAKYKQAIVDWLVGFVMIFCIHYAMSFMFYLNEELVKVASKIADENLKNADAQLAQVMQESAYQELLDNVRESGATYRGELVVDILERNPRTVTTWLYILESEDSSKGIQEGLMKDMAGFPFTYDFHASNNQQYVNLAMMVLWAEEVNVSLNDLKTAKDNLKAAMWKHCTVEVTNTGDYYADENCAWHCTQDYVPGQYGVYADDHPCADISENEADYNNLCYNACEAKCKDDHAEVATTCTEQYALGMSTKDLYKIFGDYYYDFIQAIAGSNSIDAAHQYDIYKTEPTSNNDVVKLLFVDSAETELDKVNLFSDHDVVRAAIEEGKTNPNRYILTNGAASILGSGTISYIGNTHFVWTDVLDDLIRVKSSSDTSTGEYVENSGSIPRLLSDLGSYFKINSFEKVLRDTNVTSTKNGKGINIPNMIMYAVLVGQSLILFIAYVKRLFYVLILSMLAPIVVVFDFFQKFGK